MPPRAKVSLETDTLGFGTLKAKPPEEVRAEQVALASATTADASLTCDREREAALRELLEALGLYYRPAGYRKVSVHGTLAGYRAHIRAYQTPCNPCVAARQAELDARWQALGIRESEVVIPV